MEDRPVAPASKDVTFPFNSPLRFTLDKIYYEQRLTQASQLRELTAQESSAAVIFPSFTSETAWALGLALRSRILSLPADQRKPALISIALTGGSEPHVVFQAATEPGTFADNEVWVRRKRNTVLRWGVSSWLMRNKMLTSTGLGADQVEGAFVTKHALTSTGGGGAADDFAIHGGAFPVRVKGVDGVIGVVVVSGLKQEDDHQVVLETIREFIKQDSQ